MAFVRALPEHMLLDRVIRGRVWIPLLGVMLAGIVAMQVEELKLNASIGRSIERGTSLQARNDLLRQSVATLGDDERIERLAGGLGMVMPLPGEVSFVAAHETDAGGAATNAKAPDPGSFLSGLASTDAVAAASSDPGGPSSSSVPQTASSSSGTGTTASATTQAAPAGASASSASASSSSGPQAAAPANAATPVSAPSSTQSSAAPQASTGTAPSAATGSGGTPSATSTATGGGAAVTGG